MVRLTHILAAAAMFVTDVAHGDTVVAARTIPVRTVIAAADLGLIEEEYPGYLSDRSAAIGLEAKVTLYEGRPIRVGDIGPPALVDRNQIVALTYDQGGLSILTEGRALNRAGRGDRVRVMNLSSRITVMGTVTGPGQITVP